MRLLGNVQDVTSDGKLIVKGTFSPAFRADAVDNRKRPLGRVVRVFGPVISPYVTIEPAPGVSLLSVIGKQVYVEEVESDGKTKRRDGRGREVS
jgi:rRNA processing protein Gar1